MDTTTEEINDREPSWGVVAGASAEAEERAAQAAMPPRRFDELLPCKLTDEEVATKADELEAALASVDVLKAEKKERTAEINARIKIAEARVGEIREVRRTRTEMRSVECVESFELRLGVARTTRVDTGEQIRERALRSSELQTTLPTLDERTAAQAEEQTEFPLDRETSDSLPEDDEPADSETDITEPAAVLGEEPAAAPKKGRRSRKASS